MAGIPTGEVAELIGGPSDGEMEEKFICSECGDGEIMDLFVAIPGDYVGNRHRYAYHDCDDTFQYRGVVDFPDDEP